MWITTAAQLAEKLPMTAEELAAVQSVADRYPMCITPYYLGLIDPNEPGRSDPENGGARADRGGGRRLV